MKTYNLNEINRVFDGPIDLFLCSSSFEKRCTVVADYLDFSKVIHLAVARNCNLLSYLKDNHVHLTSKAKRTFSELDFDTENPLKAADALWKLFSSMLEGAPKNILIDVSTFTHEGLLIILRCLYGLIRSEDIVRFVYVPAREYSVGDPDNEKWLSKGIREIRSVIGYPGELLPSRKIHLIVLVGFEMERARALVEAYEPSLISLGYGIESASTSEKNYQANQLFHKKMMALFPLSKSFDFSPNDYAETAAKIKLEMQSGPGYNVVIAPLNTKLSTIGSALAAIEDETIQICYAQAEIYNVENYSIPADSFSYFTLPGFGKKL